MPKELDDKLDCKKCGVIALEIPDDAEESTPIHCSRCGGYLGTWGELQDNFEDQADSGVFDSQHGKIIKR